MGAVFRVLCPFTDHVGSLFPSLIGSNKLQANFIFKNKWFHINLGMYGSPECHSDGGMIWLLIFFKLMLSLLPLRIDQKIMVRYFVLFNQVAEVRINIDYQFLEHDKARIHCCEPVLLKHKNSCAIMSINMSRS